MKVRYLLLIAFLLILIGYWAGQLVPWDYLRPEITNKEISINDYYTRLISIVGALATIFATIVALFKEDIRKLYEYAQLVFEFKDQNVLSEVLQSESTTSSGPSITAKKYEIAITVNNNGKLTARGCQVYLEQIKFKHVSYPAPKELPVSGKPIPWIGKNESAIIIPSKAKAHLNIVEIHSNKTEIVSTESEGITSSKPVIEIAGASILVEDYNGTYNCKFMSYSENAAPSEFHLEIIWNGNWQQRITEMKDCITITSNIANKK